MTAYLETDSGLALPRSVTEATTVGEVDRALALATEFYESRIIQLEIQIQELGWMRLSSENGREFGRDALDKITDLARVMYLKNPLVQRAVEIGALYVWGQDLSVNAEDEDVQLVVDRFWTENHETVTGQQASRSLEVELRVTGNVFLALFPDPATGNVPARSVPMEEIRAIVSNPQDRADVWYYRREWTEQPLGGGTAIKKVALHPHWRHRPTQQPQSVTSKNGTSVPILWDVPIMHVKSGSFPHWRWGLSELYAALDWAKAYKELLEDDATRSRALAKFAWEMTVKGGKQGVADAKAKLQSRIGVGAGRGDANPPPAAGSTVVVGEGNAMRPLSISSAMLPVDHSRPARLMASAGLGISDHMFDSDVGNHATASTLDRPTELGYSERRGMWTDHLGNLLQWVIDRDIEATDGILRSTSVEADWRTVDLSFPDLLERSVTERVAAIREAATLDGQAPAGTIARETVSRLLLTALGVEDIDGELEKLVDGDVDSETREAFVAALRKVEEKLRG